jgi:hypothetical protein
MATSTPRDPIATFTVVTPHQTTFLNTSVGTRAIWVGASGALACVMFDHYVYGGVTTETVISAIPAGTLLPFSVVRINSNNTTCSAILAGY